MAITFFYDFGSSYSYLAVMRMEEAAADAGVAVAWTPFLLGVIFNDLGVGPTPNLSSPQRAAYMWRDLSRRAAQRGLPFRTPSTFPQRSVTAARAALALTGPTRAAFTRAVFAEQFVNDRNIDEGETLAAAARAAGLDPGAVAAGAADDAAKAALYETTGRARAAGVFGAPSFLTDGGELFWGDDRLDDALRWERGVRS